MDAGETRVAVLEGKGIGAPIRARRLPEQRTRHEGRRAVRRTAQLALDRRQHLQGGGRQRPSRAWRPPSSTSAWSETASCTSTRSSLPDGKKAPRRGHGHGRRIDELIKPKQEVLVQVVKDPLKSKGARLSMQISIAGRYLVYMPNGAGVGASRRLPDAERDRQRKLLQKLHERRRRRDRADRGPGRAQGRLRARPRLPAQAARGDGAPGRRGQGAGARLPGGGPVDPRPSRRARQGVRRRGDRRPQAAPPRDQLLPAHGAGAGRVRRALRGHRAAARARGRRRGLRPGPDPRGPTSRRAAT